MKLPSGTLYIVATPIGNLADITYRAVDTLKTVDLIAAEDTRHSRRLLDHYQIKTPTLSLHEHNEVARAQMLCERLKQGLNIALISDAGTPLISDPGFRLVEIVREAQIRVVPIPGPCAAIAALVASGLPTDQFIFVGFVSSKNSLRQKELSALKSESRTLIFYESVHRITDLVEALENVFGSERCAVIARELTKTYETIYSATLSEIKQWFQQDPVQEKGEFVVIVAGEKKKESAEAVENYESLLRLLLAEMPLKKAVEIAVKITGAKRKVLYALALQIK